MQGGAGCELTSKILQIQKWVIRLTAGVNPRTHCRQLFKEVNILTIVSLYILEVISYLRRDHQFVELNSNVHTYSTRRKRDMHIQSYKTDLYKRSVVNMGSKLYNKLPDHIKEIESYKNLQKKIEIIPSLACLLFSRRICSPVTVLLDQLNTKVSFLHYRYSVLLSFVVGYSLLLLTYLSLCIFLAIDKSTIIRTILRLINELNYNCQQFGYVWTNCKQPPRFLWCGGGHRHKEWPERQKKHLT
jgi:hypothetical protein